MVLRKGKEFFRGRSKFRVYLWQDRRAVIIMTRISSLSASREWHITPCAAQHPFTVLNWNILAPQYEHYNQSNTLQLIGFDARLAAVADEILHRSPDIVTLQEVDEDTFNWLCWSLTEYKGIFLQKTGREDGCATFWQYSRFNLITHRDIRFSQEHKGRQVGQAVALWDETASEALVIGNTHLNFNIRNGELKLSQALLLLAGIFNVVWAVAEWLQSPSLIRKKIYYCPKTPAVIICGDWNSLPSGCLYHWLSSARHDFSNCPNERVSDQQRMFCGGTHHSMWNVLSREGKGGTAIEHRGRCGGSGNPFPNLEQLLASEQVKLFRYFNAVQWVYKKYVRHRKHKVPKLAETNVLLHPFELASAYYFDNSEPAATVWEGQQKGCVDYIWYNRNELVVSNRL